MDDSDEYFDDSFVLDEQALAKIDEIETRFISTQKSTSDVLLHPSHDAVHNLTPSVSDKSIKNLELKRNRPATVSRTAKFLESDAFDLNVRVGPGGTYVFAGGGNERVDSNDAVSAVQVNSNQVGPANSLRAGKSNYEAELKALKSQLTRSEELNDRMRQSLREAQEAQMVKTGEASILRNTVEKQKQEYSDVVSKAKTERIAFEKTIAELQAKRKEEADRLSASYAFKIQELQTSTRKTTKGSIRPLKIMRSTQYDGTETPSRFPRSMHTSLVKETADNDSDQEAPSSSPSRSFTIRHRALEKKSQFKGFQNAFTQSAPVKSPVKSPVKGIHKPPLPSVSGSTILRQDTFVQNDDHMAIYQENEVFESPIREPAVEPQLDLSSSEVRINPLEELQRAIFSHVAPDSDDLTLHSLFSIAFPTTEVSPDLIQIYASACNLLLICCTNASAATLNHPQFQRNWENIADKVASIIVTLGTVLLHAKLLNSLFVLLDLLLQLTLIVPRISIHFFRAPVKPLLEDFPDFDQKDLMTLFRDIIQTHLNPPVDSEHFGKHRSTHALQTDLATTILNILGNLYWHGCEIEIKSHLLVLLESGAIQTLLLPSQGRVVIKRTLQLLTLWASDEKLIDLFRCQENVSMTESPSEGVLTTIINQLSIFLTDIMDPELYDLLYLTFTLINALSCMHNDIRNSLLESLYFLPSTIICITTLTKGLWEERPEIVSELETATSTLNLLFSAVSSLHHLLFIPETYSNFSLQLMKSAGLSRKFNGVIHMFIVTFGRLSWADIPEFFPPKERSICEAISELSMELIETVVPGPECDSLWSVWHESDSMEDQDIQ